MPELDAQVVIEILPPDALPAGVGDINEWLLRIAYEWYQQQDERNGLDFNSFARQYGHATQDCNSRMDMYFYGDYVTFKYQLLHGIPVKALEEKNVFGIYMREHNDKREDIQKIQDLGDSWEMFLEGRNIVHERINIYR